ncbi:hypothetical protein [Halolactibacillus sp. JCM 19043]|uniref:hypothetical protein n=1 Tax=Halolactibacillus sp. JCM 19043 TaxID=1460638 RepID=UPI000785C290|nr:hypothetical protein [Halolactibacillus sp. JCM 19043]
MIKSNEIERKEISSDEDLKKAIALDLDVLVINRKSDEDVGKGKVSEFDQTNVIIEKELFSRKNNIFEITFSD